MLAGLGLLLSAAPAGAGAPEKPRPLEALDAELRALAALPGEPSRVDAAGFSRAGHLLPTLESVGTPETASRVVLVAGLDGSTAAVAAALAAARWYKQEAPRHLRRRVALGILACGNPEGLLAARPENSRGQRPGEGFPPLQGFFFHPTAPERPAAFRWAQWQAPDLLLEVRAGLGAPARLPPEGSLAGAFMAGRGLPAPAPALQVEADPAGLPRLLASLLSGPAPERSPLHRELLRRARRPPLAVARVLAARYPAEHSLTYIPAVAWLGALHLAALTGEEEPAARTRAALAPWLTGRRPALQGEPDVTRLGGHAVLAELALAGDARALLLARAAANRYHPAAGERRARHGQLWCEDTFMTAMLLARTARLPGGVRDAALAASTILAYAEQLQQPHGLYHHAPNAPHCWGRGNGFAALGLAETLAAPLARADRAAVLACYRRHMAALRYHQAPDGTWRQVVDLPGSYRETSATAMILAAMARGVRRGWLPRAYLPTVHRAWRALAARIAPDGTLTDVCVGTGAGPTRQYYLDRPAAGGHDERGGAMCLLAATEYAHLLATR